MAAFDSEATHAIALGSDSAEDSNVFATRQRARVLVVDDELLIVRSVMRTLTVHDVVAVQCGREAIALIDQGAVFDVVLCDLMMPDMDGIRLYEAVRQTRPELAARFVFMSGGACSDEARAFLEAPERRQLDKPFTTDAIRACVIDAIRAR